MRQVLFTMLSLMATLVIAATVWGVVIGIIVVVAKAVGGL